MFASLRSCGEANVPIATRHMATRRRCGFWLAEFLARRKNEGREGPLRRTLFQTIKPLGPGAGDGREAGGSFEGCLSRVLRNENCQSLSPPGTASLGSKRWSDDKTKWPGLV